MTPGTIGSLCATADALESSCSITAFLLRWTAFEGLRVRILTVVARMRGCSLAQAHELVDARRISGLAGFASTLKDWTGTQCSVARVLDARHSELWSLLQHAERLRHKLVHGLRLPPRDQIVQTNRVLAVLLRHPEHFFGAIEVQVSPERRLSLLNPMAKHPARGQGIPIDQNAAARLQVCSEKTPKKRPQLTAERILQIAEVLEKNAPRGEVMHVGIGRRRSWMPWPTMNSEPLLNH